MSLQPIQQEQVQQTLQVVLAYLEDENGVTPNAMIDGIVSGKSLLRGILGGQLLVCQNVPDKKGAGVQVTKGNGPGPAAIEEDMPQELKDAIEAKNAEESKSLGELMDEEEAKAVDAA